MKIVNIEGENVHILLNNLRNIKKNVTYNNIKSKKRPGFGVRMKPVPPSLTPVFLGLKGW